ncbi:LAQU0S07e04236g1_1 [Lachancea quebecensis]|uniref:LAQU0S07e04236g1_1 n=1 Tax=Lachancea quebecensis TaxID=1654605 RepID=A0A0P1KUT1_9SACH|nr:LAQU0S07e04236g1_1 [Lachancea quebecensis]
MSELGAVLREINASLAATSESLDNARRQEAPTAQAAGAARELDGGRELEKVSLLTLKNASLLAYVNSLMVVVGEKLGRTDASAARGRAQTVEHRVVLERGVRPLEKKLAYQLDKLVRAYTRMEGEYEAAEKRALAAQEEAAAGRDGEDGGNGVSADGDEAGDAGSGSGSGSDSDSEAEAQAFRPNAAGLIGRPARGKRATGGHANANANANADADADAASAEAYKPPRISAALPPQRHFEDKFDAQQHRDRSGKNRMQAMEEYVREVSEQPDWEASVGANIVDHGKGGVKTLRDTQREQRIKDYEEDNFTRVNVKGNKAERRRAKQKERAARANMIGGEDFSIFNSKRRLEDSTSRQAAKRPRSAWDRAKNRL